MSRPKKFTAVIVLNGEIASPTGFRALIERADLVFAADGGANHCVRFNLVPQTFFGDSDSVSPEADRWLNEQGVARRVYPRRKDKTDSELVLREVIASLTDLRHGIDSVGAECPIASERSVGRCKASGYETYEIILAAAFGARQDHVLANQLLAATLVDRTVSISLSDGLTFQTIARGPQTLSLNWPPAQLAAEQNSDWTFSVLALSDRVTGLTYVGADYPLRDADLSLGETRGVSNQLNQLAPDTKIRHLRDIRISFASGCLTVIVSPAV